MKSVFKFYLSAKGGLVLLLLSLLSMAAIPAEAQLPHLTKDTKFLDKKTDFSSLENNPVCEGIFAFQEYNPKLGYGNYFGFWTIDGKCLFEPRFEMVKERPRFDSGAAVVRDQPNAQKNKPILIIYANGSARELPESYQEVSQFYDGVATVRTGGMGVKQAEYFCINTKGDKIWPLLGPGDIMEVGYLRNGLRRVKVRTEPTRFRYVTRWGFIDNNGKWVLKPTYREVREFKNGYALVVTEDEKMQFIDTKGKVVYQFEDAMKSLNYAKSISDISNGYFMREMGYNDSRFFDLSGKCLGRYALASGFTDGYAFVMENMDGPISVIDTCFVKVRTISGVNVHSGRVMLGADNPLIGMAKLGTINKSVVVTPDGRMTLVVPNNDSQIGNFIPGWYAPCIAQIPPLHGGDNKEYMGYINASGEFEIVFSKNRALWGSMPPADTVPTGDPPPVTLVKYNVKVIGSPEAGGKVSGGGEYSYGDTVIVGAKATDGWMITGMSSDNRFSYTSTINKFIVRGDMTITVHFLKSEEPSKAPNGIFSGVKTALEMYDTKASGLTSLPIYLETSGAGDIKTPYGNATQGFMAIMIDPDQTLLFETYSKNNQKRKGTFSLNAFFVPMKVKGQIEEQGRKYLLVDGGVLKTNNMRMLSSGAQAADVSALESLMVNLMLMFEGADTSIPGASYRIEMNDIDPSTGAFTFGMMQRLHPQLGWIAAGSDVFTNIDRRFFSTRVDTGMPADYFNGIRMTPSEKRNDILWAPTPGFFEGNKSAAEQFASRLGNMFRAYQSEYEILKDVDMSAVNAAFDKVLKPKR